MARAARPAILGGEPVFAEGPPDWPGADAAVTESVARALADGSWGRYDGGWVRRLEEALAAYHGVPYAVTCASGTVAVEVALRALDVGPGDEVLMAAYDYPGNFLTVHALGALPVLVDLAPGRWAVAFEQLGSALSSRTRALIVSHLYGDLAPMPRIMAWAREQGIGVVEDAAQAIGAHIAGRRAGTWGDCGILSFGGSKLLTAGRGGAVLTAEARLHQRARLFLQRYSQVCPLSELQAAALLPQLDRLDERHRCRQREADGLARALTHLPGLQTLVGGQEPADPAYYKFALRCSEAAPLPPALLALALQREGLAIEAGFAALHLGRSPRRYRAAGPLVQAEDATRQTLVLHHPVLLAGRAQHVAFAFEKVFQWAAEIRAAWGHREDRA